MGSSRAIDTMTSAIREMIHAIDWRIYSREPIQQWLLDLLSSEQRVRLSAGEQIDVHIINRGQDSPENDAPLAQILNSDLPTLLIPILLEMSRTESLDLCIMLLDWLESLAGNIDRHMTELEEPHRSRAKKLVAALYKGNTRYIQLLDHADPRVSGYAVELLEDLSHLSDTLKI